MRLPRALVLPLAALCLAVAACGGDETAGGDDGGGGGGATTGDGGRGDPGGSGAGGIEGVQVERAGPYDHVLADLDYPRPAPSGGTHTPPPYWLTCGVYEGEVPDELAVHSLEHGAVWIALGPDATDGDRAAAAALAAGRKVFVSDVPDLPNPIEVVAWEHRLVPDGIDDPRVAAFVETFVDAGTAPEPGASCRSVGTPPVPPPLPVG